MQRWNYLPLLGYDEWKYDFQFRSPGKFHFKPIKALANSNLWTDSMEFIPFRECVESTPVYGYKMEWPNVSEELDARNVTLEIRTRFKQIVTCCFTLYKLSSVPVRIRITCENTPYPRGYSVLIRKIIGIREAYPQYP